MRISDWSSDVCSSDLALFHLFRLGVERLAEFHDVHAALTQSRADRRRGVGGSSGHLELDIARNLLGHFHSLYRSEERRVGKECSVRVDLGGRRIIKKTIYDQ